MNLPAHGTASPDPSVVSVLKQHTNKIGTTAFRLAQPTRRKAKSFQTAWRYPLTARRQRPSSATIFQSPPGGAHLAARRHSVQSSLTLSLSPGGYE